MRKVNPPWIIPEAQKKINYRDGNIVISVPPKSGTTWTMNIVHQLRSGGDSEFKDIYAEVPWMEFAEKPGITSDIIADRINKMSKNLRRAFKTHSSPEPGNLPFIPVSSGKTVKYIVVFRNPEEAIVSFKPFIEKHTEEWFDMWNAPKKSLTRRDFSTFYKEVIVGMEIWKAFFGFLKTWWSKRNEPNVLFIHFSEMKENHEKAIKKISNFLEYKHTKEQWKKIIKYTSFDWMKKHQIKFELPIIAPIALESGGMIRKGKLGKAYEDGMTKDISKDFLKRGSEFVNNSVALDWLYKGNMKT